MPSDLTGYEAGELERVGALLDTEPALAEDVYQGTIGIDPRAIASVAAHRTIGGGDGGSLPDWWTVTDSPRTLDVGLGGDDDYVQISRGSDVYHAVYGSGDIVVTVPPGNVDAEYNLRAGPFTSNVIKATTNDLFIQPPGIVDGQIVISDGQTLNEITIEVGGLMGFFGASPVPQQTGVAVTAAGIHAALVNLGLITA